VQLKPTRWYFARKRLATALPLLAVAALPGAIVAAKITRPRTDYSAFQRKLSKDEQIMQAANRLTFGPKPGEIDEIRKMGVKKWIDLELHPERIAENPDVAAKLQPLESLRLTQADAAKNYPNPQMIRAIALGRQPMPEDPVTRAAVQKLINRFRVKKDVPENEALDPVTPLNQLLTAEQIRTLRTGSLDQKREVLASIPENQVDDVAVALPQGLRFQLMPAAGAALRRKLMLMNAPQ
jgi:Protein of unknown function (DUF1800)